MVIFLCQVCNGDDSDFGQESTNNHFLSMLHYLLTLGYHGDSAGLKYKPYNYFIIPNHADMSGMSSVSLFSELHIYYHSPLEQSNEAEMSKHNLGKN